MVLLDNIPKGYFLISGFILLRLLNLEKMIRNLMGKKLFENYLKSQMEQKVTSSSIRVIIFSLQILIHLEKSGKGKKYQSLKPNCLSFRKVVDLRFVLCLTLTEPVSPCHICDHTKFCILNFCYIKTIE